MVRAFIQNCIGDVGIACIAWDWDIISILDDGSPRSSKCGGNKSSQNENGLHPYGVSVERITECM
jgi:hypothetical protein